jgi:plasmid maintenance system antidote protein VapI
MSKEQLKEVINEKATPKEALTIIIKEVEKLSYPKFNEKIGLSKNDSAIKNLMANKISIFPDELALALEKEYGIPFKWWKTGEGEMFLACEDKEYLESLEAKAKELSISPDLLDLILEVTSQEPELMSFAAKSIRGDKAALERFYKLLS